MLILLLAVSGYLFVQAWWGRWAYMLIFASGALAIVLQWLRMRRVASPWNLLAAVLLLFYYSDWPGKLVPFMTVEKTTATYDAFLYHADRSFGFAPSILVAGWVDRLPHANEFFFGVYMALSLAMGACYAAHIGTYRAPWRIALTLTVTATIGVLCYNLLPACGPLMLLGAERFLHGDPFAPVSMAQPVLVSIAPHYARNAIPSLHMTWALLVLWFSRDLKRAHWGAAAFAFLTAVSTLSTGEHYLVDLVVAFPFALAIWSMFVGDLPLSHPTRTLTIAGAATAYLGWTMLIRFAPGVFYLSPAVPWLLSAATVAATLWVIYSQPPASFAARNTTSELKQADLASTK